MLFLRALPSFLLLLFLSFLKRSRADATSSLNAGATATPAPLVVPPSQDWDGNDGQWSSFFLRVGTPPQTVRVLISTAGNQPLVVLPEGCSSSDPSDCGSSRGGIFQTNASSTWIQNNVTAQGIFALAIETNLGLSGNALYGYDTVALSYPGSNTPSLNQQVVGGIATKDFYMGLFGLNPAASNFSTYNDPQQSYMSSLKSQNQIPSLSYGYTAGNTYRFNGALGSLTIGGYDASLFQPNELTCAFDPESNFDLTVNIQTITVFSDGSNKTLSPTSFPAFLDSTVPYLYLPVDVCRQFEEAFSIVYDNVTELYLVNDTLHSQLLAQAANVTFTLTNATVEMMVDIVLPYQAFDLVADYPLVQNKTRFFPLKRAENNTQITLGRTFLQEAYLIADYERSNFSISQRKWDANAQQDIQTILPPSEAPKSHTSGQSHVPMAAVVAGAVGGSVLVTLVVGCIIIIRQRSQKLNVLKKQQRSSMQSATPSIHPSEYPTSPTTFKSELDAINTVQMSPELDSAPVRFTSIASKVTPERPEIYELPAMEVVGSELLGSPVSSRAGISP